MSCETAHSRDMNPLGPMHHICFPFAHSAVWSAPSLAGLRHHLPMLAAIGSAADSAMLAAPHLPLPLPLSGSAIAGMLAATGSVVLAAIDAMLAGSVVLAATGSAIAGMLAAIAGITNGNTPEHAMSNHSCMCITSCSRNKPSTQWRGTTGSGMPIATMRFHTAAS
jgi:hypothetical protein